MRILHLVGRSHRRGAEQVALELAAELDARGHRDRLLAVTLGHDGGRVPELEALVSVGGPQRPPTLVRAARRLRPILRDDPPDVVLAHGAAAALVAVGAAPRRGPAIVFQTIVGMAPQSFGGVQGAAWRVAVRRLDGVVALTEPLGEEVQRLGYRGPVWAIPNARRTERFVGLGRVEAATRLRAELGVAPDVELVGLVGYLVDQKRPERAVEVLAGLVERGRDVQLVVAGAGPLEAAVRGRAVALGVEERTAMLGHRDDVPELLAGLDLLVLTSDDEGVPGIVIEAAMAGCPVVTFPLGGVAEVVADGRTGVVLERPSVAELTAACDRLLGDPAVRAAMSAAARDGAAAWSMEVVADRYEAHLAEVVPPGR